MNDFWRPPRYGNCTCSCHTNSNVCHVVPCCYPGDDEAPILKDQSIETVELCPVCNAANVHLCDEIVHTTIQDHPVEYKSLFLECKSCDLVYTRAHQLNKNVEALKKAISEQTPNK